MRKLFNSGFLILPAFDWGLLLAGLVALFVILPLLQPGLPATADTPIHFYRALEFSQSWGLGVMYPRWAPNLAYGYGYPLWIFAPPLPYLIPLAAQAAGASLETGFKLMILLAALSYAVGAYLFARQSVGPKGGLIAAAIYTLSPFALREALLYGGNFPQFIAIGLYPWVLWSLERIDKRRSLGNVVLAALLYGVVILSHLFHAMVITPVAMAYVFVLWLGGERSMRQLGASALALLLGLLWTAFFWLPAFVERSVTRATTDTYLTVSPIFSRFLNWGELLAWPQPLDTAAANPWLPFSLGVGAIALAVAGVLAILRAGSSALWLRGAFFLALLIAGLFMMLPASTWLWVNIPLLGVAEFPWRLLGLVNLSLAFLGGASVLLFPKHQTLWTAFAVTLVILSSAVYLYPPRPFVRYEPTQSGMTRYELATQTIGTTTLGEYLPSWVETMPDASPLTDALTQGRPINKLDAESLPPEAAAQQLEHTAVSDSYTINSPEPFQARFFTFYFPGWRAKVDGQTVEIDIEAQSGLITIPIPAGLHTIQLNFTDTSLRRAANWISLLTMAALLALIWRYGFRRAPSSPPQAAAPSPGWTAQAILVIGGGLLALLLLKTLLIDPQSNWFRRHSPPEQVIGAQQPAQSNLDNKFKLLGYTVNQDAIAPGDSLRVVLYWLAQQPANIDYRSFAHLDSPLNQRTLAGSDNFHPGDATAQIDIPTSTWDAEHYIRDEHFIAIPLDTPPVTLNLRAGLYNPATGRRLPLVDGGDDAITLQNIQIKPGHNVSVKISNRVGQYFGDNIQLLGYDWDEANGALILYWQSNAPLTEDYIIFTQLLDRQGNLAWGYDSPPFEGLYPTSTWQPDTPIVETRAINPTTIPPGEYALLVGMYHPETLERIGNYQLEIINYQ